MAQMISILKDFIFSFTLLEKQKKTEDTTQKRAVIPIARVIFHIVLVF